MEKGEGEVQGTPSTQVTIAVSSGGKEIGLTKVKGTSFFENLSAFVRANSSNRIANCWNCRVTQSAVLLGLMPNGS